MSEIVGSQISSGAYQKLQAGYENAQKFIEINQAKNRVMAAQGDSVTNKTKTPLLLSNNVSFSTVESVSVKLSSGSAVASPATFSVIVLVVSPAAKVNVPEGRTPPWKSAAAAGFEPDPETLQFTVEAASVGPVRVTV